MAKKTRKRPSTASPVVRITTTRAASTSPSAQKRRKKRSTGGSAAACRKLTPAEQRQLAALKRSRSAKSANAAAAKFIRSQGLDQKWKDWRKSNPSFDVTRIATIAVGVAAGGFIGGYVDRLVRDTVLDTQSPTIRGVAHGLLGMMLPVLADMYAQGPYSAGISAAAAAAGGVLANNGIAELLADGTAPAPAPPMNGWYPTMQGYDSGYELLQRQEQARRQGGMSGTLALVDEPYPTQAPLSVLNGGNGAKVRTGANMSGALV